MKKIKVLMSLACVATISVIMAGITGCESDGDTGSDLDAYFDANPYISDPRDVNTTAENGLSISPETATASTVGQKIVFTLSGGDTPITWAVAGGAGSIAVQSDTRQAIYTVGTIAENNVIASDTGGNAAIADILVSAADLDISPASGVAIVDPTAVGPTHPAVATFTASGGTAPYAWSIVYTVGNLSATTGASVNYTATSNTNIVNVITVVDSKGNKISSDVTHNH